MTPSPDLIAPSPLALSLLLTCGALVPQVAHAQTYTLIMLATFTGSDMRNSEMLRQENRG